MPHSDIQPKAKGGCACRAVRDRLESAPLIVNGCHCRRCQRDTGSALAINASIESDRVSNLERREALLPQINAYLAARRGGVQGPAT